MSTTPAKPSIVAKLETDLIDVGEKVKAAIEDAGNDAVKLATWLGNNQATIDALAGLAGSGAASAAALGTTLTSLAINAVKDAGSAAESNGVNVSLDSTVIADIKALIAAIEKI